MNLDVPFATIEERLTDRWIAESSGRVYTLVDDYKAPKVCGKDADGNVWGKCDDTGEDLIRRDDDSPEVVQGRLQTYEEMTAPLLSYYEDKGQLTQFAGTMSDVIYKDVGPFVKSKFEAAE